MGESLRYRSHTYVQQCAYGALPAVLSAVKADKADRPIAFGLTEHCRLRRPTLAFAANRYHRCSVPTEGPIDPNQPTATVLKGTDRWHILASDDRHNADERARAQLAHLLPQALALVGAMLRLNPREEP